MEKRMKQLEEDLQCGQEEAVEKAVKKAKCDRPITFRQKARYEQFK